MFNLLRYLPFEAFEQYILYARGVSNPKSSRPVRTKITSSSSEHLDNENRGRKKRRIPKESDERQKSADNRQESPFKHFGMSQKEFNEQSEKRFEELFKEIEEKLGKDAANKLRNLKKSGAINRIYFLQAVAIVLLVLYFFNEIAAKVGKIFGSQQNNVIDWNQFITKLFSRQISRIVLVAGPDDPRGRGTPGRAYIFPFHDGETEELVPIGFLQVTDLKKFCERVRNAEIEAGLPPEHWVEISWAGKSAFSYLFPIILFAIIFGLPILLMTRLFSGSSFMNISSMMGNRLRILDPASKDGKKGLKIKFRDVAGLHEAKVEVTEFVDYLRKPQKYVRLGAKLPKGALLTGPPGCGKTLLAKALAAESSVPFINVNGTEFVEMIGGLGASRVRQLFKEAKSRAPCIIYIDELDAIGRKRQNDSSSSGELEQTLNQLLVEMDGIDTNKGVVVVGSTNRLDTLDKALLRPGRFDRHITVDLPTLIERRELFDLYLQKIKKENLLTGVAHRLAQMTPGFSGADIANVVNEAAIHAATAQKKMVRIGDIDFALQKIIAGPEKRSRVLVEEEREVVAFHESGHALVGWLLEHTEALLRVSIIPRTNSALGFAQYSPKDRKLFTKEELFDRMCMMLGGRAAENVAFGRRTTGAQNDLEKVTKQAQAMVKWYGMNELVGPISFHPGPGVDQRQSDFTEKPYSKKLGNLIDQEVGKLVADAYYSTEKLLRENEEKLDKLAKTLLERETLSYEDVKKLIGPPKYGDKQVVDLPEEVLPDLPNDIEL